MSEDKNEVMNALTAVREVAEKSGINSPEFKALEAKTATLFETQEKANQEVVAKLAQERKDLEDVKDQVKDLEVEIARKSAGSNGVNFKETSEYKALNLFASKGAEALDMDQKALLRTDSDTAGGYLTSSEMDSEIIRLITEISPIRQVARTRTIGKKTLEMPKRTGILTATYEGETEAAGDSTSDYGSETITANALTVNVPFTYDMLLSSDFDIEAEINRDVAEAFAQKEGNKFLLGDGVRQPEGILANASVIANARESETSGVITGDDIILMTGDLKEGYNPIFGFNRQTLAFLRTLKGSNGQYLWNVGLGGGKPNQLAGEDYLVMQDVPAIASGALSVIYGDFMRGYTIIDRTGLAVVRDEVTRKKERIIELCFHKYNTGQVVLEEAFKALKIKA
jgi:HK97 family phage major capsid protein